MSKGREKEGQFSTMGSGGDKTFVHPSLYRRAGDQIGAIAAEPASAAPVVRFILPRAV